MIRLSDGYSKNSGSRYLFSEIAHKVSDYKKNCPERNLIRLDIGDVTLPLPQPVTCAMAKASYEMSQTSTFRGYGEEQGYLFLREAIAEYYYRNTGYALDVGEIFVSDGAKSDIGNFRELFPKNAVAVIPNPTYPVYRDSNLLANSAIVYSDGNASNGFLTMPESLPKGALVYICSPNNPTGASYNRAQLSCWVEACIEADALILFDSAYEAFVEDKDVPRSIYEIDGASTCAIEFCSLSKTAGFTGVRCGYTIVPYAIKTRCGHGVNRAWLKRQTTKFNGVSYIVQRGAQTALSRECEPYIASNIAYYKQNAKAILAAFDKSGIACFGGKNSPYVFADVQIDDVEFFDKLLSEHGVTVTPGSGFGTNGKSYVRLTAFNTHENTTDALTRIRLLLTK